ncbi:MAG: endolytic transglycosylase MltG, partial [Deltaproteobacteria bacterium]|nr:endolytic transglycosylase MltG [Deltaproteobacteria bacterium]
VFHNRLRAKIPLQSDPSVIYGLKGFSGSLTRKDLQSRSPYNTYRIPGLPPGPICNPGLASLRAALYPARVPYLYFVSRNDGSHLFSASLGEHNRAVRFYQSGKQRHPRP